MVSKTNMAYGAPSCLPLKGGRGKTPSSASNAADLNGRAQLILSLASLTPPKVFSVKRIAMLMAVLMLCLHAVSAASEKTQRNANFGRTPFKKTELIEFLGGGWRTILAMTCFVVLIMIMMFIPSTVLQNGGVAGDMNNIFDDGGASMVMRLGVIIPSAIFIAGSMVSLCMRKRDLDAYEEAQNKRATEDELNVYLINQGKGENTVRAKMLLGVWFFCILATAVFLSTVFLGEAGHANYIVTIVLMVSVALPGLYIYRKPMKAYCFPEDAEKLQPHNDNESAQVEETTSKGAGEVTSPESVVRRRLASGNVVMHRLLKAMKNEE